MFYQINFMKSIKSIILTLAINIFVLTEIYSVPITVTRTQINGGKNGYYHISGYNTPVYDAGGNVQEIKQTINCTDPGSESCPAIVMRTSGGTSLEEEVNNPSILLAIEELAVIAVSEIDSGNLSDNDFRHICINNGNGSVTCYLITISWTSSTDANGVKTDILTFNYTVVPAP
jgi:hypothetical protein